MACKAYTLKCTSKVFFTINLMTSLTGLKSPYKKAWVSLAEYSEEDQKIMEDIRSVFFKSVNVNERWDFLKIVFDRTNSSSAIVIINGRTTHWLSVERMFIISSSGIPYDLDLDFIQEFSTIFSVSPI